MRLGAIAIGFAVACGGSPKKPAEAPQVSSKPVTRVPVEDSEPEEGVTIINAHGHMEPAAVEAGIAPYKQGLSDCYMSKVGRRRWLGGHVVLHWDIKRDGTVTAVKLAESDLGAWPIEKCLLEVARQATFDKPIGGDADFSVPLEFSAKGQTTPWDDATIMPVVTKQRAKLEACSKKVAAPAAGAVTLYVGPHGAVLSAGFSSAASVLDPAWADCVEKAVLTWHLPDPKGQVAKVSYNLD